MTMAQKLTAAQRKLYAPIEESISNASFRDWCAAIIETLSDSAAHRLLPVIRDTIAENIKANGGNMDKAQTAIQLALTMLLTLEPATGSYWKNHKAERDNLVEALVENLDGWEKYSPYGKIAQNRVTNALAAIPRGAIQLKLDSPDAVATVGKGKSKVDFVLRDALENGALKTQDNMLLDALLMEFYKTRQQTTLLSLDDYLRLRGREVTPSNRKEMRKEVIASLERLQNIRFTYNEKAPNGKYYQRGNVRLNGGTAVIENSVIRWNWNADFMNSLMNYAPLDYSKETLLADPRTNVYYFSRFFDAHQRRNEGKPNANTVTVAKLLEVARNISTIEEVKAKRGSPKQKIIEPFFRDLDNIDRLLYSVYDADGNEIQPEEIMDYETFIGCKIVFTLEGRPENLERIAARKKREKKQGK